MMKLLIIGVVSARSMWGTYKPNLYFGLKDTSELSQHVGLFWIVNDLYTDQPVVRHLTTTP